jgi:glycerol-3-phosphate dehydrogenase
LSREARHLFVVPWRDHSLIGVWHVVYDKSPDDVVVREDEIANFCREINSAYPALALDPNEVTLCNAGLVPFGENVPGAVDLNYGKESRLIDHAVDGNVAGLVTLIGIRYTMGRGDAAKAIDMVCGKLGRDSSRAPTHRLHVQGGDIDDFEGLVADVSRTRSHDVDPTIVRALIHNYGTAYRDVLSLAERDPSLAAPINDSRTVGAQVLYAIRDEMAQTLADIVLRRTDIATGQHPGRAALEQCADIAATELGWSADRRSREIDGVADQMIMPTA